MRERNLWRYPLFSAVAHTPFFLPTIVLFYKDNGLNMFEVFMLQGLFAIAVVFLEVPTGMIADQLGKRQSLLSGSLINAAGFAYLAMGSTFVDFFVAEIILAVGISLLSGADSAMLYDTLKSLGREEEYKRREGQAKSWQMVSFAAANLFGGFIGAYSYRAAIWCSVIGPLLAFVLAWGFVETGRSAEEKQDLRSALDSYKRLLGQSLRFVRKHQLVRWYILFFAIITGSSTWLLWLYQPYMKFSGLPVWAFGGAFALFNLFAAFASHQAHAFEQRMGPGGSFVAMAVMQIAPLVALGLLVTPMSFLFILGHQAVRGVARPVVSDHILRYTYADKRATVLSINSLMVRLFFALTAPLVGWIANVSTMSASLLWQAALLTLFFVALWFLYRRIPTKYFAIKSSVASHQ